MSIPGTGNSSEKLHCGNVVNMSSVIRKPVNVWFGYLSSVTAFCYVIFKTKGLTRYGSSSTYGLGRLGSFAFAWGYVLKLDHLALS